MDKMTDKTWTQLSRAISILTLLGLVLVTPITCTTTAGKVSDIITKTVNEKVDNIKNNDLAHLRLADEYSMEKDNIMISYQFNDITKEAAKDRLLQVEKWKSYALGVLAQNLTSDSKKDYLPFTDWLKNQI